MSQLIDPRRQELLDELLRRYGRLVADGGIEFVALVANPGQGKTRLVQELYETLREGQSEPPFWPPLLSGFDSDFLDRRHRVYPHHDTHFADHDPKSEMEYLWWALECGASNSPLTIAIEEQIQFFAPSLLQVEVSRGHKVFDWGNEYAGHVSNVLGLLSVVGVSMAVPPLAVATAAGAATAKWFEWRGHRREKELARDLAGTAGRRDEHDHQIADSTARLSNDLPVILVIDNAHRADERVVAFLQRLLLNQGRVLVVMTAWPEGEQAGPFYSWWSGVLDRLPERVVQFDLGWLSDEALSAIFDEDLPGVDPSLKASVIRHVEGNPLLLRAILAVPKHHRRLTSGKSLEDLRLPRTLIDAYAQFWDGLSEEVKEALCLASYLGRDFVDEVLLGAAEDAETLGQLTETDLQGALARVVEISWIRQLDGVLRRFVEQSLFDLARDHAQDYVDEEDERSIRLSLQRFVADLAPGSLSPRTLEILNSRFIDFALTDEDLDAALATSIAINSTYQYLASGDYSLAGRTSESVIDLIGFLDAHEELLSRTARACRAEALSHLGHFRESLDLRQGIIDELECLSDIDVEEELAARGDLAISLAQVGRLEDALTLTEKVLEARSRILGPEHPDTLATTNNLANRYSDLGRLEDALTLTEKVLEARSRILGPEHPDTLATTNNLANRRAGLR